MQQIVLPFISLLFLFSSLTSAAGQLNPANYLVAHHQTVREYTPGGAVTQTFSIESPDGETDWQALDVVVDQLGRIHVLNRRSFDFFLSTLDPVSGGWIHHTDPQWNIAGVLYYGGIGADRDYIYVPDQKTAGTTRQGILRFPINRLDAPERFAEDVALIHCVKVGLDGLIYALERAGPDNLHVYDPATTQRIRQVSVHVGDATDPFDATSVASVAANADGEIFTLDLDGRITHFAPDGTILNQVTGETARVDLDLDEEGTIVCGSGGVSFSLTDESLLQIDEFPTPDEGGLNENFVTFARPVLAPLPPPVPSNVLSVLIHSGDPAPGTAPPPVGRGLVALDAEFATFEAPVLNNLDEVAFCAALQLDAGLGVGLDNREGIWSGNRTNLQLVARTGDQAPDLPVGVLYHGFGPPGYALRFDDAGHVSFPATLRGTGVTNDNDSAFFSGRPGAVRLVAREGDPVPGADPGVVFGSFSLGNADDLRSGAPGEVWFRARLTGAAATNDTAFFAGPATNMTMVFREGDPAPGFPAGVVIDDLLFSEMRIGSAGDFATACPIRGDGIGLGNRGGVWTGNVATASQAFAQDGAANAVPGFEYNNFGTVSVNPSGTISMLAEINSDGSNDSLIVVGAPGAEVVLAREGDPAPGTTNAVFANLAAAGGVVPALTASGQVAFVASLQGPTVSNANQRGIWLGPPGNLQLLARDGDQAAGLTNGVVYGGVVGLAFSLPAVNALNQAAFQSGVSGPGIGLNNRGALWCGSPGALDLVAQRDDILHTKGMDRTIFTMALAAGSGGENGKGRGLNDLGRLAFQVTFQAGQGQAIMFRGPENFPPTIELVSGVVTQLVDTAYVDPGFSASDPEDGDLTDDVVVDLSGVDTNTPGVYEVRYSVEDSGGQEAGTTRTVVVTANQLPKVELTGGAVTQEVGAAFAEPGFTANDAEDGDLTDDVRVDLSGVDTNTPGIYEVEYEVEDSAGQLARTTRTVVVVDTTPPVIILVGGTVTTALQTAFAEPGFTAADHVDGDLTGMVTVDVAGVDIQVAGVYTVTYDVVDAAGNAATQRTRRVVIPEDFDRDGLPDAWELVFTNRLDALHVPGDLDDDGSPDADEFDADTDPTDATDLLQITDMNPTTAARRLTWDGKATRDYTIQFSTNLPAQVWIDSDVIGQSGVDGENIGDPGTQPATQAFRVIPLRKK